MTGNCSLREAFGGREASFLPDEKGALSVIIPCRREWQRVVFHVPMSPRSPQGPCSSQWRGGAAPLPQAGPQVSHSAGRPAGGSE